MRDDRTRFIATLFVVGSGSLWGLYWLPVRRLSEFGLGGAWGTLAIVAAAARLEPARVGILLMAEVLVGVVSAAAIAGEQVGPLELAGGALVLAAGVLEVWPVRRGTPGA